MTPQNNLMGQETNQTPGLIKNQLIKNKNIIEKCVDHIKQKKPLAAMTIARGSSDHAASFAKYLIETQLGLITSSSAPSVNTVYNSDLNLNNMLVIGISQSGKSPDICHVMTQARKQGAITIAIVNETNSPLADAAEFVIPLHAGPEKAVAATKSYMCTLSALLQFIAIYKNDNNLLSALDKLPSQLEKTLKSDWSDAITQLKDAKNMFVIARGTAYPIAQEAALKLKETSCIQAEPFSSAEVLHGPFALIKPNFPALIFIQNDQTKDENIKLAEKITSLGANTLIVYPNNISIPNKNIAKTHLILPESINSLTDSIVMIIAFYKMANSLAISRGFDPDSPENLKKVTETK